MSNKGKFYFLHQFALNKLATHLQVNPAEIKYLSEDNIPHHLEYNNVRYMIKMASPSRVAKDDNVFNWDFDMRADLWSDGKTVKVDRPENICDFYILIGMKDGQAIKTYLIPHEESPTSHIRIAVEGTSKYTLYEI